MTHMAMLTLLMWWRKNMRVWVLQGTTAHDCFLPQAGVGEAAPKKLWGSKRLQVLQVFCLARRHSWFLKTSKLTPTSSNRHILSNPVPEVSVTSPVPVVVHPDLSSGHSRAILQIIIFHLTVFSVLSGNWNMLWEIECFFKWNFVLIQLQGILDCDSLISGLFYSLYIVTMTELYLITFLCL